MSALELLQRGRRLSPDGPAMIFGDTAIDYATVIKGVESTARDLGAAGIGRGDVVGVLAPNHPSTLIASYAATTAGATYLPVAGTERAGNIASLLNRFGATMLAYHPDKADLAAEVRELANDVRFVPFHPEVCAHLLDLGPVPGDQVGAESGLMTAPRLTDIAWLGVTGGTTGEPKGVQLSWLAVNAFVQKYLAEFPTPHPVMLLATPLTHAAGMLALPTIARGGTLVLTDGLVLPRFLDLIERHQVNELFLPPTGIYKVMDDPSCQGRDFSSLTNFFYGAAPISLPRLRQAIEVFGPVMTQSYGQTECHTLISVMKPADHFIDGDITGRVADDARLSGCGWPSLGTTIEIRDDDGHILPAGKPGEICVASDLSMTGYYRSPEATAATLRDGFVRTGDIGFLDADGCLHIIDRQKDLVISGGFNVYPAEVEATLRRQPGIADCAVVGLPDAYWGEILAAAVIPEPGAVLDPEQLSVAVKAELGPVKTPKHFAVMASFPQSGTGKILKKDIREQLAAELVE
ncbi:AMP-binding protein [Streptomyces sp. NPDC046821]|uniref:AMP-binding protein n=1 Tax=Streptomyces sp. NPDC046821 TaxID=3154702 RepID=UPI00340DE2D0